MTHRLTSTPDVVVVGDGIVGRSIARDLAGRGFLVDVVDAGEQPASLAAAGMLSPLPESKPASQFQFACLEARDLWGTWAAELSAETTLPVELWTEPSVFPVYDDEDEAAIDALAQRAIAAGEPAEELDGRGVLDIIPTIRPGVRSGLLLANDPRVDPHQVMSALGRSLEQRDVLTHRRRAVRAIRLDANGVLLTGDDWSLPCETVVIAAGAWCAQIGGLGLNEVIKPVRGEMIAFRSDGRWQGAIRRGHYYALTRGGEILFGATEEEVGFENRPTRLAAQELRDAAESLLPKLAWRKTTRHWSGLRPGSADDLPVLGAWQSRRIQLATGTFRNGILLGPWIGQTLGTTIAVNSAEGIPDALAAARFSR